MQIALYILFYTQYYINIYGQIRKVYLHRNHEYNKNVFLNHIVTLSIVSSKYFHIIDSSPYGLQSEEI